MTTPDAAAEAPGWDAIERAVAERAHARDPLHWGTGNLPGQGLYGLNAYRTPGAWLLVSLGLSELFAKESEDAEVSGWGVELTMRLPRADPDQAPPPWALRLVDSLAGYVYRTSSPFGSGHRMDTRGPITGGPDTRLTALAFTEDPELGTVGTPNGRLTFLEMVGITQEELARMKETSTASVLEKLARSSPLLVTDPTR